MKLKSFKNGNFSVRSMCVFDTEKKELTGIKMVSNEGEMCPVIFCDVCNGLISDSKAAHVEYKPFRTCIRFVHKACCPKHTEKWPSWEPLEVFFSNLLFNTKIKAK